MTFFKLPNTLFIKKNKLVIIFASLVLIVFLIFALIFFLKWFLNKKYKVGQISIPKKTIMTVTLSTNEGKKQIYRNYVDSSQLQTFEGVKEDFFQENYFLQDFIIFKNPNDIGFYNKSTREYKNIPFPEDFAKKIIKGDFYYLNAYEVNKNNLIIRLTNNTDYYYNHYLFDINNYSFKKLDGLDKRCGIYCLGPWVEKQISDNEYIFHQGDGDACWSSGKLFLYNLLTGNSKSLLDYANGCIDKSDGFVGFFGNNILASTHKFDKVKNNNKFLNLYSISPYGIKTILISASNMPPNIDNIWVNPKDNIIYLNEYSENNKDNSKIYYIFDIKTKSLQKNLNKLLPRYESLINSDTKTLINENSKYFEIKMSEVKLGTIKEIKAWNTGIRVLDADNDLITLVPTNFLSNKFEAEKTDGRLQVKLNVYRNYRFSDTKILSEKLIQFTGAVYYSTSLVQEKTFVMSLESGNVYSFGSNINNYNLILPKN